MTWLFWALILWPGLSMLVGIFIGRASRLGDRPDPES